MSFKGNSSVEKRHTIFAALFRHFLPYTANPLDGLDLKNGETTVIFIAGISRTLDYQAHTTSYGEVRHTQYIPSMRAIQTTSHKINHKEVSISQKEC